MRIVEDLDLTPYNSYRLSARCARAFFPETEDDVKEIYRTRPRGKKILLGSGHNVILAREWYDEDFVIFANNFNNVSVTGNVMTAEAGAFSARMSEVALVHGLSGLEFLDDIPSSLGGAIVMNAGAGADEIRRVVATIRYLDLASHEICEIDPDEAGMAYRDSVFQRSGNSIVLSARLVLQEDEREDIQRRMKSMRDARWAKQPRNHPNAGSVFKRPPGRYVGPMIEAVGLKGFAIGGAAFSTKHAGIIVNGGGAKAADILNLISIAVERVHREFGVLLEPEQRVL